MSHILLYMLVHIIPLKTLCELILSEEALGDIQLSDLQARADLVMFLMVRLFQVPSLTMLTL